MFGFGACHKFGGGPVGFGPPPWVRHMHKLRGEACGGPWAILGDLDLTDEQLEKLAELKMEGLGKFAQFKSSMVGLVQQIAKELSQEQVDKAKVKEIAQQIKSKKSDFGDSMLDRILAFADVLTVEQRRKLKFAAIRRFLGVESPATEGE